MRREVPVYRYVCRSITFRWRSDLRMHEYTHTHTYIYIYIYKGQFWYNNLFTSGSKHTFKVGTDASP